MTIKGPRKLTPQQEAALLAGRDAADEYFRMKRVLKARMEEQLARELSDLKQRRDAAVAAAVEAGVPKSRIAREGLGTTSTNEVYEIVAAHNARREHGVPELSVPWETFDDKKEN